MLGNSALERGESDSIRKSESIVELPERKVL